MGKEGKTEGDKDRSNQRLKREALTYKSKRVSMINSAGTPAALVLNVTAALAKYSAKRELGHILKPF